MAELIPFLRTIAKTPNDDTPRLVFSDWLDEHEHHELAEFIRLPVRAAIRTFLELSIRQSHFAELPQTQDDTGKERVETSMSKCEL